MLTIFTIPKTFQGHNRIIQLNAIRSWMQLSPRPTIIFLGNDAGTAEIAAELGMPHYPEVAVNEYGTPLISSVFSLGVRYAATEIVCYVNADIILLNDFLPAIGRVERKLFLIVGRRWDLDVDSLIDYENPDWEKQLREQLTQKGVLHPASGIDYFCFPRSLYENIPPFAIGRGSWDNWLLYRARELRVPVIDATGTITAVHANHDYAHLKDGAPHFTKNVEMKPNLDIAGGPNHLLSLDYATHLLTGTDVKRALTLRHLYFRLRAFFMLHRVLNSCLSIFQILEKAAAALRRPR